MKNGCKGRKIHAAVNKVNMLTQVGNIIVAASFIVILISNLDTFTKYAGKWETLQDDMG